MQDAIDKKKAKKEDKEHLQKLRDQIAADRAEKASKFNTGQVEQVRVSEEKKQQKTELDERQRLENEEQRKRFASIQFRLPDGSAPRNQFEGSALFAQAEEWISQQTNTPISSFQLVQMFPRREFTNEDRKRSFAELSLTPSAVLMVLPNAGSGKANIGPRQGTTSSFAWVWGLIATVVSPLRFVYNYLYAFVFGQAAAPRAINRPPNNANNPSGPAQQPSTSGGGGGNIARFKNVEDSKKKEDDNATWNGNSTQQL